MAPLPLLHSKSPAIAAMLHIKSPATAATRSVQARMDAGPVEGLKKRWGLFQDSRKEGFPLKQAIADAIAGEYDVTDVQAQVKEEAMSAPLVLFTWEASPACKKALDLLKLTDATPKVIRLDNPWSEGNVKRAALGRLTGKSSVPSVWIGGKYVGGCDDGPTADAPGLVKLAFSGKLQQMLESAGAMSAPKPAATLSAVE